MKKAVASKQQDKTRRTFKGYGTVTPFHHINDYWD